jgi:hypothetical protein
MAKTGKAAMGVMTYGLAAALVGAVGCGGVSQSDVVNARTQATTASCNYFMMCNEIGPGDSATGGYDNYQDCTTQVMGSWTSGWPTATCQGHIDQAALTVCLDAIGATTDCNAIAELITLGKCGSATVCSANVSDGGGG